MLPKLFGERILDEASDHAQPRPVLLYRVEHYQSVECPQGARASATLQTHMMGFEEMGHRCNELAHHPWLAECANSA